MKLSVSKIGNAKPLNRPYKLFDGGGLYLRVMPNGSKLWRLKYRFSGKEKLLSFGPYPIITLKAARAKRDEAKLKLLSGIDPQEAIKQDARDAELLRANTFGVIADEYIEKLKKEGRSEKTIKKNLWLLNFTKPKLWDRVLSEITAPEILSILRKVEAEGKYETAHRLKSVIGTVFRFAIAL